MEAIILAGGLGTRLRSRLVDMPKAMAPVAGRPFLKYLLDLLVTAQANRVILSVGYLQQVILDQIPCKYRGLDITFLTEESPLGTGGAIRHALQHTNEPSVFVMNGDTYVNVDYSAMHSNHAQSGSVMTIAVTRVADTARYGGVVVENERVVGFFEKGKTGQGWINAGLYVLNRDFPWPSPLPSSFSFEEKVLAPHLADLQPAAFCHTGFFLDIGVPEDLDKAQTMLPQMQ